MLKIRMEQQPKRKPTPASWKPGQSGNSKGRPRAGLALAEKIRERIDPDLICDLALRLAGDESVPVDKRLATLLPFVQLGYLRPPTATALQITDGTERTSRDWGRLSLEQRRVLLELADAAAVPAETGTHDDATD